MTEYVDDLADKGRHRELQIRLEKLKKEAKKKTEELLEQIEKIQRKTEGDFPEDDIRFLKNFIDGTNTGIKACEYFSRNMGKTLEDLLDKEKGASIEKTD